MPAATADTSANPLPAPLQFYKDREIAPYMTFHGGRLAGAQRTAERRRLQPLAEGLEDQARPDGVRHGLRQRVLHARSMARLVGERGRVLAVDIQPEMLSLLDKQAKGKKIKNVEPRLEHARRSEPARRTRST